MGQGQHKVHLPLDRGRKDPRGEDIEVRQRAVVSLASLGIIALPVLTQLAERNEAEKIAGTVIQALGEIGANALPILDRTSRSKDSIILWYTAKSLGKLGAVANHALFHIAFMSPLSKASGTAALNLIKNNLREYFSQEKDA